MRTKKTAWDWDEVPGDQHIFGPGGPGREGVRKYTGFRSEQGSESGPWPAEGSCPAMSLVMEGAWEKFPGEAGPGMLSIRMGESLSPIE